MDLDNFDEKRECHSCWMGLEHTKHDPRFMERFFVRCQVKGLITTAGVDYLMGLI